METLPTSTRTTAAKHPTEKMKAVEWHGTTDVRVVERPRPIVSEPTDAIVKVTTATVCGSDLHLYHNEIEGMMKGDVLGHEAVGIVHEIGSGVKNFKVGDRVAVSAIIADGTCEFCKKGLFSLCDTTNPSKMMQEEYGKRTAGIFGYSHLTGGYEGCQAQFVRVPFGDVNLLLLPDGVKDDQAVMLSDVACTGWHANELGEVKEGQTVAVWGCGPVGLMTLAWAKFRGARRLIAIDNVPYRLDLAQKHCGAEIIDFSQVDVVKTIHEIVPGGPDVCIDAAGYRFAKSLAHKFQRLLRLEGDTPEILTECIKSVKKGGNISIVGDYFKNANAFPIGNFMECGLTMRGGQLHCQAYWKKLLGYIVEGQFDPSFIVTHHIPLERAPEAYRMFDKHEDGAVKVILKP